MVFKLWFVCSVTVKSKHLVVCVLANVMDKEKQKKREKMVVVGALSDFWFS